MIDKIDSERIASYEAKKRELLERFPFLEKNTKARNRYLQTKALIGLVREGQIKLRQSMASLKEQGLVKEDNNQTTE